MKTPQAPSTSRRRFLATAGLGVASAATLRRATAQGSAANSRIRLGVIGCGGRGSWITDLFKAHGGYEIVALADYFDARIQESITKNKLTGVRGFTGLQCGEKLVAAGGVDAVAIISPPYFHPQQVKAAVAAKLHVYLAKPPAVDVPSVNSIAADGRLSGKQGRVFLVDFQTRANEFYIEALRRLHAGQLGEYCFGEAVYHSDRLKAKAPAGLSAKETLLYNWVFDQVLSGDIIVEQNIHTLDVMSWVMKDSPPVRCSGTGGRRSRIDVGDCWDHFALMYEYPNNVGITFSSRQYDSFGEPGGIINRMFGTKGVFSSKYGGQVMVRAKADDFYRGGMTTSIYKDGAVANIKAFHEQVLAKDTRNPTLEPSITSNLVAIMGRMAAYEKRTITWNDVLSSKKKLQVDLSGLQT
ncbi:MAG: Gfo/Idh/MocA family oxidoreductase [Verrucomicrobia bacterium]|nr:Gfo/Idh/MocA family oxidoreductase [Verrucomicrobiota bacterium]